MPTKRISGFRPPYSLQFILCTFTYLVTSGIHYMLAFCIVDLQSRRIVIVPSILLGIIVVISWVCATMSNPESTGFEGSRSSCLGLNVKRETRFCTECQKMVFEIDHHCSFLNNCIGSKNYTSFLILILASSIQMLVYILCNIFFQLSKKNIHEYKSTITGNVSALWTLVALHLLLSVLQAGLLLALVGLHAYLILAQRVGTYDWLLQRRNKRNARRKTGYSPGVLDEESVYSHISENLVVKLRQQEREAFEQSLFAGKKGFHDSFRSNLSALSSPLATGGSFRQTSTALGAADLPPEGSMGATDGEDLEMLGGMHRWLSSKGSERQSKGSSGFASGLMSPASGKSGRSDIAEGPSPTRTHAAVDREQGSAQTLLSPRGEDAPPSDDDDDDDDARAALRVSRKKTDPSRPSGRGTRVLPGGEARLASEDSLCTLLATPPVLPRGGDGDDSHRHEPVRGSAFTVAYD